MVCLVNGEPGWGGGGHRRGTPLPDCSVSCGCAVAPLLIAPGWLLLCVLGAAKRNAFQSCLQRAYGLVVADRGLKSDETIIG